MLLRRLVRTRRLILPALVAALVCTTHPHMLHAQAPLQLDAGGQLEVGGEAERYWRALQVAALAPFQPISIRPIGSAMRVNDSSASHPGAAHPWSLRWQAPMEHSLAGARLLRPGARLSWNSTLPVSDERGPAWQGRGVTVELRAGMVARLWRLHLQLEPVAWATQNAGFPLVNGTMRDPRFPNNIDLPQRFGVERIARVAPGNSALWLELPLVTVGASTRAQAWGPGREYPLMLSANAGGFPHLYLETPRSVPLGIGRLHTRVIGGTLPQSRLSTVRDDARWGVALAAVFAPRGVNGLEVGFTRFIHGRSGRAWPAAADYRRLFTGGLSGTGALNSPRENQLASAFFRWQVAPARMAVYGELLRDDYSLDFRRSMQYPDDLRTFMLGFERVLRAEGRVLRTLHAEWVNGELPSSNLSERGGRGERRQFPAPFPPYLHSGVTQGHTVGGQLLGAPAAYGGAGWRGGFTSHTSQGRRTVRVERTMRLDWLRGVPSDTVVSRTVRVGLTGEQLRFGGQREWLVSVSPTVDLNYGLQPGRHLFNLRLAMGVRGLR